MSCTPDRNHTAKDVDDNNEDDGANANGNVHATDQGCPTDLKPQENMDDRVGEVGHNVIREDGSVPKNVDTSMPQDIVKASAVRAAGCVSGSGVIHVEDDSVDGNHGAVIGSSSGGGLARGKPEVDSNGDIIVVGIVPELDAADSAIDSGSGGGGGEVCGSGRVGCGGDGSGGGVLLTEVEKIDDRSSPQDVERGDRKIDGGHCKGGGPGKNGGQGKSGGPDKNGGHGKSGGPGKEGRHRKDDRRPRKDLIHPKAEQPASIAEVEPRRLDYDNGGSHRSGGALKEGNDRSHSRSHKHRDDPVTAQPVSSKSHEGVKAEAKDFDTEFEDFLSSFRYPFGGRYCCLCRLLCCCCCFYDCYRRCRIRCFFREKVREQVKRQRQRWRRGSGGSDLGVDGRIDPLYDYDFTMASYSTSSCGRCGECCCSGEDGECDLGDCFDVCCECVCESFCGPVCKCFGGVLKCICSCGTECDADDFDYDD